MTNMIIILKIVEPKAKTSVMLFSHRNGIVLWGIPVGKMYVAIIEAISRQNIPRNEIAINTLLLELKQEIFGNRYREGTESPSNNVNLE